MAAARALLAESRAELRGWEWRYLKRLCGAERAPADGLVLKGHSNGLGSVAFGPSSDWVVTGGGDRTARVWDVTTGAERLTINDTGANICLASVSRDGSRILTTNTSVVRIWSVSTGELLLDLTRRVGLEQHWPFPFLGCFSPDGRSVVTGSPVFQLALHDSRTGDELMTLKGHQYWANESAFSPDGRRLATGCQTVDDAARVWDTTSGVELLSLKGNGGSVWSLCFSPDGKQIATGGVDGRVRLWDATTGAKLQTLVGHERVVTAVAFSPDGSRLVTGSQDRTARIWEATTGIELLTLQGHTEIVTAATFSPDGTRIATASFDGTARIWDSRAPAP